MKQRLTALIILSAIIITGLSALGGKEQTLESNTFFALGTTCTVSIYGGTEQDFSEIEKIVTGIENRMSVNIADSEISMINKASGSNAVTVSSDVYSVIAAGQHFSELSSGKFDISIGPLVQLWDIGGSGNTVPSEEAIKEALALVDYSGVEIVPAADNNGGGSIYLPRAGMALEPGGIAKGYAADAAAAYLRDNGTNSALINFGGNVLAVGSKSDGSKWRIGIQNPDSSRGDYIGIVPVEEKAVVTSGKYERFFIGADGLRYHHILSTESGYPVENGIAQVSIIATESMTADALSTAVFSLGLEDGMALVDSISGVETVIVMENGNIYITENLKAVFQLTDNNFSVQ